MRFGPFRPETKEGIVSAFRQLGLGLRALSTENVSPRGLLEKVLNLVVLTYSPVVTGSFLGTHDFTYAARYIVLHRLVWVNIKVEITTSGVADNVFSITLPVIAKDDPETTMVQGLNVIISDTDPIAGFGLITKNSTTLDCYRYDRSNYGTGAGRQIIVTGWYLREI